MANPDRTADQIPDVTSLDEAVTRAKTNLAAYLESPFERRMRAHQIDVMQSTYNSLANGESTGYVSLLTGAGKSHLSVEMASVFGLRTVFLSPTQRILKDTYAKALLHASGLRVSNYYAEEKGLWGDAINTTYQSLPYIPKKGLRPWGVGLVVADEAHLALGEERHQVFRMFPNAIMLGLTATPYFDPLDAYIERKVVDPAERWTGMFTNQIHDMSLEEGIERRIVAGADVRLLRTQVRLGKVDMNSTGDYKRSEIERQLNIESRNSLAVAILAGVEKIPHYILPDQAQRRELQELHELIKGKRTAVFGISIAQVEALGQRLEELGIKSFVYHSKISSGERDKRLEGYSSVPGAVLLGVDALGVGWDSPETEAGILLDQTRSSVELVQTFGRLLRLCPEIGKNRAVVIQFVDQFIKGQAPVLIPHLFEQDFILRGSNSGRGSWERSRPESGAGKPKPPVTISGMSLDAVFEQMSVGANLPQLLKTASIPEMRNILNRISADIYEQSADPSMLSLLRELALNLPYFIPAKTQNELLQAMRGDDPELADDARKVFVLLNSKTVISAVGNYLGINRETDDRAVAGGIENLMSKLDQLADPARVSPLTTAIHTAVRSGAVQALARWESVAAGLVREGTYQKLARGLHRNLRTVRNHDVHEITASVAEDTGLQQEVVSRYVRERLTHSLGVDTSMALKGRTDIEKAAESGMLGEVMDDAMKDLNPRERRVLELRFGLQNGEIKTLGDVGKEIGISQERVRQIEAAALRKLRHPSRSRKLRDFL